MLVKVRPDQLGQWWSTVGPMLIEPLSRIDDDETLDDVRASIKNGDSMLWIWLDGQGDLDGHPKGLAIAKNDLGKRQKVMMALVLRVHHSWLHAWLVAGEQMDLWLEPVVGEMRKHAETLGLRGCQAVARPGLAKALRQRGWRSIAELVRLPNGRAD